MRKRIITGLLALTASLALALPAWAADPAYYIDTNNGRVADPSVVEDCSVSAAVDLHRGYGNSTDEHANAVSGHVRLTLGADTARVQVDNIRVGSVDPAKVDVNDLFPSARSTARNNTPEGGYVVDSATRVDLMDERDFTGDTEPPYEPFANGLNSGFDFSPDVFVLRAYGDWISTTADLNGAAHPGGTLDSVVQVTASGTARCRSGELNRWSIRTTRTETDA